MQAGDFAPDAVIADIRQLAVEFVALIARRRRAAAANSSCMKPRGACLQACLAGEILLAAVFGGGDWPQPETEKDTDNAAPAFSDFHRCHPPF